jgi:hypothetical protein
MVVRVTVEGLRRLFRSYTFWMSLEALASARSLIASTI